MVSRRKGSTILENVFRNVLCGESLDNILSELFERHRGYSPKRIDRRKYQFKFGEKSFFISRGKEKSSDGTIFYVEVRFERADYKSLFGLFNFYRRTLLQKNTRELERFLYDCGVSKPKELSRKYINAFKLVDSLDGVKITLDEEQSALRVELGKGSIKNSAEFKTKLKEIVTFCLFRPAVMACILPYSKALEEWYEK